MYIGARVKRKSLPDSWGVLKKGHRYFGLELGQIGTVKDIIGTSVYLEEYGDWAHHIETLELV